MREFLAREKRAIDDALDRLLPESTLWPSRLHEAMRHAVLGGGKRIRPILARLAHQAAGGDPGDILEPVCGLEMIHTYSLVHDDLPAMDDDVLRRGRPTVHVAFDEATAILAGDALLTEGLAVLARHPAGARFDTLRSRATALIAEAASSRGMVGGQMEDLVAERDGPADPPDAQLDRIHRHKTGCLLRASVELGALLASVGDDAMLPFTRYGECLGLAFQVADDVLDATSDSEHLGKSPGKDAAAGKLTFVTLYGLENARRRLHDLENEMVDLAADLEGGNGRLAELARFVVNRTH